MAKVTETANCNMTESGMNKIISKNKKFFSFYRGKWLQFDYETGEIIRWDNSQIELMKRIKQWNPDSHKTSFIYGVPLMS